MFGKKLKVNEPLPVVAARSTMLQYDEICHYSGDAKYKTSKNVVTGYKGNSGGFSVRIFKGFSYRTGANESKAIREDVVQHYSGILEVTNKRIVFNGQKGSFDVKLSRISSMNLDSESIIIQVGSKVYTLICKNPAYVYQIIMRVYNDENVTKYVESANKELDKINRDLDKMQAEVDEMLSHSVSDEEIERIKTELAKYPANMTEEELQVYAAKHIVKTQYGAIGNIQREFKIGFNRANRIMNTLYEWGVVGEEDGTKPRKVLMNEEQLEIFLNTIK